MFAKLFAEFLGTFWLVLGGCGSAVLAEDEGLHNQDASSKNLKATSANTS